MKYYINTRGIITLCFALSEDIVPNEALVLMYNIKECSYFKYNLFMKFGINLVVGKGKDPFYWTKGRFESWINGLLSR